MPRAALYARVSTRDKDQDPENQLIPLRALAVELGYEPVAFIDHASGKDLNRPEWQRMMQDVNRSRFKAVLVLRVDRAFRSVIDGSNSLEIFDGLGIRFVPLHERMFDTGTPVGKAAIQMAMVWAELERGLIQARIKEGMARSDKTPGRPRTVGQRRIEDTVKRLGIRGAARELGMSPGAIHHRVRKSKVPD